MRGCAVVKLYVFLQSRLTVDFSILQGFNAIYAYRNERNGNHTIDLHGLQVEFAMLKFESFIATALAQGRSPVVVITGAGNHSVDKALIKPKVQLRRCPSH